MQEFGLHQCVLLLQRQAQLSVLVQQGVELQQVSSQGLRTLHQLSLLTLLYFNLTWGGGGVNV